MIFHHKDTENTKKNPLVWLCCFVSFVSLWLDLRAQNHPNILFLISDDQRADTIASHGNPHILTPNLDQLVERGFSFRLAYCMGSLVGAVCVPSRAMLHSGRTLFRVPADLEKVPTLAEVLGQAGYFTFGTGKWHNKEASLARGFARGNSIFFGGMSNHLKVPIRDLKPDGTYSEKVTGRKFSSELFADAAIDFLKSYRDSRPFFLYVAFTAPHDPRMPPPGYVELYPPKGIALPKNFLPQHPFDNGHLTVRDENLAPWPRFPDVIREQTAYYYGMITHLDHQIGRILETLKETGKAGNTIIVFASDHGLAMGSHGLLGKQNLYEHSTKAPLIFAGPGIPANQSSGAFSYLLDVFPTICELVNVEVPEGVEGQSLAPIWQGRKESVRESVFTAFADSIRAVRDERWKLIRYPRINKSQLFDLQGDPHEMHNLAEDPAHSDRVRELMALLREWQARVGDQQPLSSQDPEAAEIDLTGRERTPDPHQPDWIVQKYFEPM